MSSDAISWAFRHSPMTGATLQVHLAIGDSVNDLHRNEFWMSASRLAQKARVSDRTARSALHELVEAGLIELLEQHRHRPSKYRFLFPDIPVVYESRYAAIADLPEKGLQSGAPRSATDREITPRGLQPLQTNPSNELTQEKQPITAVAVNGDVAVVWDSYIEATGKTRAHLSTARRRLISAALAAYPRDDVVAAVRGWRWSRHHCGQNDRGTVYNDIELLLRDAKHIEQFRDWELGVNRPGAPAAPSNGKAVTTPNGYLVSRSYANVEHYFANKPQAQEQTVERTAD